MAVEDLSNIWHYAEEKWSEKQADRYYSMLIGTIKSVSINPYLGRSYQDIFPGLKGILAGRHLIFYRVLPNYVEITRILHTRMDVRDRLL